MSVSFTIVYTGSSSVSNRGLNMLDKFDGMTTAVLPMMRCYMCHVFLTYYMHHVFMSSLNINEFHDPWSHKERGYMPVLQDRAIGPSKALLLSDGGSLAMQLS